MSEARQRRGDVIIIANAVGTFAFTVTAVFAAAVFTTAAQWVGAITAMSLFAIGVFAFLWAFYNAVQRSRAEQLSVMQLFFLVGTATPRRVRWIMNLLLLAQVAVGLATALARPNGPDGTPGSSLAVGILVPMFGIGLNGLWAAFHGDFPELEAEPDVDERTADETDGAVASDPESDAESDLESDRVSEREPDEPPAEEILDDDGVAASGGSIDKNGAHG